MMLTVRFEPEREAVMLGRVLRVETGTITLTKCTALEPDFVMPTEQQGRSVFEPITSDVPDVPVLDLKLLTTEVPSKQKVLKCISLPSPKAVVAPNAPSMLSKFTVPGQKCQCRSTEPVAVPSALSRITNTPWLLRWKTLLSWLSVA